MNDFNSHVRVLAVSPHDGDLAVLSRILSHSAWTLLTVGCVTEARNLLQKNHVHVVLTERRLSDGDWKSILDLTAEQQDSPQLVVLSKDGDERLWAEVLNLGAWDILIKPFHPKEVYRTIHAAWQHGANRKMSVTSTLRRGVDSQRMPPAAVAHASS
jgi:two-component system response regulator PilR (NtrC family)